MAEDRRARLAALASRAGRGNTDNASTDQGQQQQQQQETNDESNAKVIKFRNYTPKDAKLDPQNEGDDDGQRSIKRSKMNDESASAVTTITKPKTELEKALLQAKADATITLQQDLDQNNNAISSVTTASAEVSPPSVTAIAPKKVNWDLKRDIAKKMNRLERRTQKAIVELLRERLEREADEEGQEDEDENDLD
jgi:coiled-coil domain-containing protein 12